MAKRFTETHKIIWHDADVPANGTGTLTNLNSTNWIDCSGYHRITAIIFRTVGTGKVQDAGLYVSAAATGTNAALIGSRIGSTSAGGLLNAANGSIAAPGAGMVVLEASWDEISAALAGGRYVCARLSFATGTDEFGVAYILSEPRYPTSGLTVTGSA